MYYQITILRFFGVWAVAFVICVQRLDFFPLFFFTGRLIN